MAVVSEGITAHVDTHTNTHRTVCKHQCLSELNQQRCTRLMVIFSSLCQLLQFFSSMWQTHSQTPRHGALPHMAFWPPVVWLPERCWWKYSLVLVSSGCARHEKRCALPCLVMFRLSCRSDYCKSAQRSGRKHCCALSLTSLHQFAFD